MRSTVTAPAWCDFYRFIYTVFRLFFGCFSAAFRLLFDCFSAVFPLFFGCSATDLVLLWCYFDAQLDVFELKEVLQRLGKDDFVYHIALSDDRQLSDFLSDGVLTDAEAKTVMEEIDADGSGQVNFVFKMTNFVFKMMNFVLK